MPKAILITGSTDGIGLEAAKRLVSLGHHVLLHGRNPAKLEKVQGELAAMAGAERVEGFVADLSELANVEAFAKAVADKHTRLDVLINNAGVFKTSDPITKSGLDVRFVVNTIAPYLLTKRLLPLLGAKGRVINLSSAAQAPVDPKAIGEPVGMSDSAAYAQSKLALTMWSRSLAQSLEGRGPTVIAVNPGSLLATKMVTQAYGVAGSDIGIGANILCRAALDDEFAGASGKYFDNDSGQFAQPHPDALDAHKCEQVVRAIEGVLAATSD